MWENPNIKSIENSENGLHNLYDKISIDDIKLQIKKLRNLDLNNVGINDIKQMINKLMTGYACCSSIHKQIQVFLVLRSRINNNNCLYKNVKELIYPPAELINKPGRLNEEHESVFYGALDRATSIVEIQPIVRDIITVIEFSNLVPYKFQYMELGLIENIMNNPMVTKNLSPHSIEKNDLIRNFLVDEFTKKVKIGNEHDYKITIAIGKIFLTSSAGTLLYPSVTREKKRINIAMRTDIFDKYFKPNKGWLFRIDELISISNYKYSLMGEIESIGLNGEIKWKIY